MKIVLILVLVGLSLASKAATVYYTGNGYQVRAGLDPENGVAYGTYNPQEGWNLLKLDATTLYPDEMRTYGLGYLEGTLTAQEMTYYYDNINELTTTAFGWPNGTKAKVLEFLLQHYKWAQAQIAANPTDPTWMHVNYLFLQMQGIMDGFNNALPARKMPIEEFLFITSFPDTLDISAAVQPQSVPQWLNMTKSEAIQAVLHRSRCSGFVKPTADSDLYTGHSTWIYFSMLTKIYKVITLPLDFLNVSAQVASFSSYPGSISSTDDWYQLSSNLVVLETSNSIFNQALYKYTTPQTLLSWQRVTIANRMATGGAEWSKLFANMNSGTYNNQWMIVDYNKWTQGSKSDVLWVVEQIPGLVESSDVTDVLFKLGYWPSYNIPYFENIYNMSGYPAMYQQYGDEFSYEKCPRAQIFARNQTQVTNINAMQNLMRYNNWENDPLSGGSGAGAICCRGDMGSGNLSPFGCTDSKVTSVEGVFGFEVNAIYGPTWDQQTPFSWSNWQNWPHEGLPNVYNYTWTTIGL